MSEFKKKQPNKRKTSEEFIAEAVAIHGDRFDYSLVDYINNVTKVKIICKIHGVFEQNPSNHLKGCVCKLCGFKSISDTKSDGRDVFIEKAKAFHGERYGYDFVEYINSTLKVKIECKIHGIFEQNASNHIMGHGCPRCMADKLSILKTSDKETFIASAILKHGDRFDYSKVEYISAKAPVIIICHKHGEFTQTPNSHLNGCGCLKCSNNVSKPELEWISSLNNDNIIQHYRLPERKRMKVDGYDPSTNTVYQFHGSFWHGDPRIFDSDLVHPRIKNKTYGDVLYDTIMKNQFILDCGYRLVTIWEFEWDRIKDR